MRSTHRGLFQSAARSRKTERNKARPTASLHAMLGSWPKRHVGNADGGAAAAAYKDKHEQVLRIAASDVAAVAGYHEWVDVRELFLERLLYQDLDHLLRLDAANMGMEVEDRHQRSERLLAKAGSGELRAVRRKAGDGAAVATVQDAHDLRNKARSLLKEAEGKSRLSKSEAKELEDDLSHDINTQFGTRNENFALSVYERRSGTEVICSNERILVWPFPGSKLSGDGVPDGALDPPAELSQGWTKRNTSRCNSKRALSTTEAEFSSAVTRCLANLPALGVLERSGGSKKVAVCATGAADDRAHCLEPAGGNYTEPSCISKEGGRDEGGRRGAGGEANGVERRSRLGGGEGETAASAVGGIGAGSGTGVSGLRDVMDMETSGSDVVDGEAGERIDGAEVQGGGESSGGGAKVGSALPPAHLPILTVCKGGTADSGEKRELVPGVAWPEWRTSKSSVAAESLRVASAPPVPPATASEPGEAAAPSTPGEGSTSAREAVGPMGEHGSLWFPSSLNTRQRTIVRMAAGQLGFCHASVAGEAGAIHVAVWEPAVAAAGDPLSRPSEKPESVRPDAHAVVAAVPSGGVKTRRGPSLPSQEAAALNALPATSVAVTTDREVDHDQIASGLDSTTGAAKVADARLDCEGQRGGGRGSTAAAKPSTGSCISAEPAATAAREVRDKIVEASSSTDGGAPTAASEEVKLSGTGTIDGNAEAAASGAAVERHRLIHIDDFGGDAVYAWGEGPVTPSEEREKVDDFPDGYECSLWSRNPPQASDLPPPEAKAQAGEGRAIPVCGATKIEEESPLAPGSPPPPTGRSGAEAGQGRRVDTPRERRNACFVVVGAVDGVAEEVTDAPDDAETWETRRVVVEVKNRMNKARHPPPLYDQIQLVTYMLMIGAPVGDLVQFVKTDSGRSDGRRSPPAVGDQAAADNVLVSRVELDCRAYRHKKNWEETILPRLYAFARMVYRFRGDDLLRWRYLVASPNEQREMLVECCPYLDSVIHRAPMRPPRPLAGGTELAPEVVVLDHGGGGGVETLAAVEPEDIESGVAGSHMEAPDDRQGDEACSCEEQRADGNSGGSGSSSDAVVNALAPQRKQRGPLLKPPGNRTTTVAAVVPSPARKKAKTGDEVAVDRPGVAM